MVVRRRENLSQALNYQWDLGDRYESGKESGTEKTVSQTGQWDSVTGVCKYCLGSLLKTKVVKIQSEKL